MKFINTLPEWKNEGVQPQEELLNSGFQAGYRPPAAIFNWFWSKVCKCIRELQNVLTDRIDVKIVYSNEATDMPNTLYLVIDGERPPKQEEPEEIDAVAYDNVIFSADAPSAGENWFQTSDEEGGGADEEVAQKKYTIQNGRLTVLKEPEKDTKFLNN